ncbi:MAG: histidine phosphatase family protein [Acidimicrobiales bacterium]|jgi:2,3-bisphosphoglycerate-dependent phosphoglycerate mutase
MILRPGGQRVLRLVRHSESNWNSLGWVRGQADGARLTRKGRQQAQRAVSSLQTEDIAAVYSVDLRRAQDTAAFIADRLEREVETDQRPRERCFGELEGSWSGSLPPADNGIRDGKVVDAQAHPVSGQSLEGLNCRCADLVESLVMQQDERDVAVVTHGGSIRMIRAFAAGTGVDDMSWGSVANASIRRVVLPLTSLVTSAR